MAGEDSDIWPVPKLRFEVDIAGQTIPFSEVPGMDAETQVTEYREGASAEFSTDTMSGAAKFGNLKLKRGILVNASQFWDWYDQITMNTATREDVTIRLLDEAGKPRMVWVAKDAWPVKVSGIDEKAEGSAVAIDSMELAHDGLTLENGG